MPSSSRTAPAAPALAVLGAAVCFATTGSAVAVADVDASPTAVGAVRILLGGGVLGILALLVSSRRRRTRDRRAVVVSRSVGPVVPALVAMGAAGVLAYQPAFFAGTQGNGVAVGTVVALGTAPVATGVLDAVVRRRAPGARWLVATAVALVGVGLVGGLVGVDPGAVSATGVLASVGAGASYALYAVAGKLLLDRGWRPTETMGAMFGLAAVGSLPLVLATGDAGLLTPRALWLALWLGLVTTVVAYLLFGWGLKRLPATTAATLTLAEPLTATLLGLLVLGERLGGAATGGLLLIAAGITILTVPVRRRAPAPV